jgi:hypothetical protein
MARNCYKCNKEIVFSSEMDHLLVREAACGCWCGRWWCCKECAELDGWKLLGGRDAIIRCTEVVYCNFCDTLEKRKKPLYPRPE